MPFYYCPAPAALVHYRSSGGVRQSMKPMFLPGLEHNPQPGAYRDAIEMIQSTGAEYPQIWHMFAFRPEATQHLARFTQEILRGPAPMSPGIRELIAAY